MNSEVAELCRSLVQLPSVNPQGQQIDTTPYGEARMVEFVHGWLSDANLAVETQQVLPGRENVLALAEGTDKTRTLLLCAHMDTVDVRDMTVDPFAAEVRRGRIYGRGTCDDKGPLAALMISFRDRVQQGRLPCNLALLATCGEEYGMTGSEYFAANNQQKLAGVVVAEPTDLQVVVAHKGVVRLDLNSKGRSAHSSTPKRGKNAIYPMARAITVVECFIEELEKNRIHDQLGHETAAVTIVHGGQQINVIPDNCQASIDWRIIPGRDSQQCRDELNKLLQRELPDQIEVSVLNEYKPMITDASHSLVLSLLDAAEQVTSQRKTTVFSGATDASAFVSLLIPTPIFGPGGMGQAHTQEEYIEINKLEQGLEAYNAFLAGNWM